MITNVHQGTPTLAKSECFKSLSYYYLEGTYVCEPRIWSRKLYIAGFYGEKAATPSREFISYNVRKCSNLALNLGILLCLDLKAVHVIKSKAKLYWFYKAGYVSPVLMRFTESFIPEG